ncbi:MAG: tRNA lysidine(34) synthetase TilS [Gracilibacteraceae bacterium]|jgi:tRNA(Ile)-lysidine synthase|nr:tRNA lysidine(34) synthetase TilS [Gracilibacteraceae bacterium]
MAGRAERLYARLRAGVLPSLLPPGSRVLAAVSGGPDSVALAHILWRYLRESAGAADGGETAAGSGEAADSGALLVLTHVNHGTRPEAAAEEKLTADLGRRLGAPVRVHRFDAKAYAQGRGVGFQAAAREWRYARWREDMAAAGCSLLATAHHRGDQAETVLLRLLRGGGGSGLAGIRPERDGIIRPLLDVSKSELLAYCAEENLAYAEDASNLTGAYDRNRVRLHLLPLLQAEYNDRVEEALSRAAAALGRDEDYFAAVIEEKWPLYGTLTPAGARLSFAAWREPAAIVVRLLRRAAALAGGPERGLTYAQLEALRRGGGRPGWRLDLPGLKAWTEKSALILAPAAGRGGAAPDPPAPAEALRAVWQDLFWGRAGLWPATPPPGFSPAPPRPRRGRPDWSGRLLAPLAAGELALLPDPLVWRCRQPGDKCRQPGGWHKSLKNVWQAAAAPAGRRELWPLLAAGGEIIWIPGLPPLPAWRPAAGAETVYACVDFSEFLSLR